MARVLLACASEVNGKDYFVSSMCFSRVVAKDLPDCKCIDLVQSWCTRDPVDQGSGYAYKSRRGILVKAWSNH